jgi:hypothetical protein
MPTDHTCKDGDCLSSIAAQYKLPSIQPLQDANAELKKKRPSPNLLAVGDVVKLPEKKEKEADANSGGSTKFQVKFPKAELRVYLRGVVGEKLPNVKCVVTVAHPTKGFTKDVTADGEGLLKLPIPADATGATLEVALPDPPKPEKPPDDGLEIPKETFTLKDEKEDPAAKHEVLKKIVWTVALGTLHPVGPETDAASAKAFITGAQRRLHNLGYPATSSGALDEATKKLLKAFKDRGGTKEDTALGQKTADALVEKHDKGAT